MKFSEHQQSNKAKVDIIQSWSKVRSMGMKYCWTSLCVQPLLEIVSGTSFVLGLGVESLAEWKEQFCTIFFLGHSLAELPFSLQYMQAPDSAHFFFSSSVSFLQYVALGSKEVGEREDEDGAELESVLDFGGVWTSCSRVLSLGLSGARV
jgi:hypothetical protein